MKRKPVTFSQPKVGDIIYADEVFSRAYDRFPSTYLVLKMDAPYPDSSGIQSRDLSGEVWYRGILMLDLMDGQSVWMEKDNIRYFSVEQ